MFTVIILDENQGWQVVTTFGPYDTREQAEEMARVWFDEIVEGRLLYGKVRKLAKST